MKTEEQIYNEIIAYINSDKHNKPCTLQSIKKELRTEKIVDLVFSHPKIFNFESELKHVPQELRTEELLMKYVLSHPYCMSHLNEEEQTLSVMVAFEICKRRYERISAMWWGSDRERIPYYGKTQECRKQIQELADKVGVELDENKIEEIIEKIQLLCGEKTLETKTENYISKFNNVHFDSDKRIVILISGHPDSGKTTFGNILKSKINDSVAFDSDMLLLSNCLGEPFSRLAGSSKVVIFSDLDADRFFSKEELAGCHVVNVYIKPESAGEMYRNSKYMRQLSFEEYMNRFQQEGRVNEKRFKDAIHVTNTYDAMLIKEADKVINIINRELTSENEEIIENN